MKKPGFKMRNPLGAAKLTLKTILIYALGILAIAFLYLRIRVGIDLTDESWLISSIFVGFNDGLPFGFSILWHWLTSFLGFNVLQLRLFRLCLSVVLILVLAYLLSNVDEIFKTDREKEYSLAKKTKVKFPVSRFVTIAFFGIFGIVLSYSYFPPILGYNESVVLLTQINISILLCLIQTSRTKRLSASVLLCLLAFSSIATFVAKFSSGVITLFLLSMYLYFFVKRQMSIIYIAFVIGIFGAMYTSIEVFRGYISQVILISSDKIRADHFGHSYHEVFIESFETLKLFIPVFLACLATYYILSSNGKIRTSLVRSLFVTSVGICVIFLITNIDLNRQFGFPANYQYLRLFMIVIVALGIILIIQEFKFARLTNSNSKARQYFYVLSLMLVFAQPVGSNNEPWGILLASAGTLSLLVASLALSLNSKSVSLPNLKAAGSIFVVCVIFMSVYSGMNSPYRQASVFDSSYKFQKGPFKGISTDKSTFTRINDLGEVLEKAASLGVTDLFALDTPILGVLNPRIIAQPIWLAQFWGITPDVVAENCLSDFNSKRVFALYLPNGEQDWPQLEDAFALCGLSRDKFSGSSLKLLEMNSVEPLPPVLCSETFSFSREYLGQGWWPSDNSQYWSHQGLIQILLPPVAKKGAITIPYSKLIDGVKVKIVKSDLSQSIDYKNNTIRIELEANGQMSNLWLQVSNAKRPINVMQNNEDVRELGISVKELQVSCEE